MPGTSPVESAGQKGEPGVVTLLTLSMRRGVSLSWMWAGQSQAELRVERLSSSASSGSASSSGSAASSLGSTSTSVWGGSEARLVEGEPREGTWHHAQYHHHHPGPAHLHERGEGEGRGGRHRGTPLLGHLGPQVTCHHTPRCWLLTPPLTWLLHTA